MIFTETQLKGAYIVEIEKQAFHVAEGFFEFFQQCHTGLLSASPPYYQPQRQNVDPFAWVLALISARIWVKIEKKRSSG